MNKKCVVMSDITVTIIAGITATFSLFVPDTVNLDKGGTNCSISTVMGSQFLGNSSDSVNIIEFGDYGYEQCYEWFYNIKPIIAQDYIKSGKASFVLIDLAFLGSDFLNDVQASYCIDDQKTYWKNLDILYTSQESIDNGWTNAEKLKSFAFNLDLDMTLLESWFDSEKYSKRVQYNIPQVRENDLHGALGFFIVGFDELQQNSNSQPFSIFKQILDTLV